MKSLILIFVFNLFSLPVFSQESKPSLVLIPAGIYRPFYPADDKEKEVPIKSFYLQSVPVSNGDYLTFIKQNPQWQKGKPTKLFSDARYLSHWKSITELGASVDKDQPLTHVSWFAAKAYCEWKGLRLPRESEWEYAAVASETQADSRNDLLWRQRILDWYSKPASKVIQKVGKTPPNYWGIYDLHGLIWEWVLDFNNAVVSSDSRDGKEADKNKFCGAASLVATEKEDYATFMRMAFRGSLKANYTTSNLGFRCAKDGLP